MEIKVGEYIRTKLGDIKQITEGFEFIIQGYNESSNKIVKHSSNIMDLIEEGDYVNGKEILEIKQNAESGLRYLMYSYVPMKYYVERSDKIKSIVTKEQFDQMKYIVGE